MGKESKYIGRDISVLVTFFLFQIGLCAIIMIMSFISNFSSQNYDIWGSEAIMQLGIICDIISTIFIAIYAVLAIDSFIKRRNYTIQLAMSYLFALFINANIDLLETILSYNINTLKLLSCILAIVWFAVWLIYLYYSKQIEELFPLSTRMSRKRDYLPMFFIAFPPIIWVIFILVY